MDPKQIPFLVQLLDEDDSVVQQRIMQELSSFGPLLKENLRKQHLPINPRQQECLDQIFENQKRIWLKQVWPTWFNIKEDYERLEGALTILAQFLTKSENPIYLSHLLDKLADTYRSRFDSADPKLLAHFLFREVTLKGNQEDYHNPQNNNLIHVVREKKGIPISLSSIYMLVGNRLELEIEGCNFPGHFLARIDMDGKKLLIDCYNQGQMILEADILRAYKGAKLNLRNALQEKAEVDTMVRRFLANLIRAFQMAGQRENHRLMIELFKDLDRRINDRKLISLSPQQIIEQKGPIYRPGEIIVHQRYGYRGIVVESDGHCKASDEWYYANQTQPEREQPWYHVLVNGSDQVTYVAQSSLTTASLKTKIDHPLVTHFFIITQDGLYKRNTTPWPEVNF